MAMTIRVRGPWLVHTLALLCAVAAGCGDSSFDSPSSPSSPIPQQNSLSFRSAVGDWIGLGRTYHYTSDTARFMQHRDPPYRGSIVFNVQSNDFRSYWTISMGALDGQELRVGTYENAESWTPGSSTRPRFSLWGDGRGCQSEGRFTIRTLTYRGSVSVSTGAMVPQIDRLHVLFDQRCTETSAPGLTGELSFVATP